MEAEIIPIRIIEKKVYRLSPIELNIQKTVQSIVDQNREKKIRELMANYTDTLKNQRNH